MKFTQSTEPKKELFNWKLYIQLPELIDEISCEISYEIFS